MSEFNAAVFRSLVGQTFRLERPGADARDAVLTEVQVHRPEGAADLPTDEAAEVFSIFLRVAGPERPQQATFAMSHPAWGEAPVFLVPVGVAPGGFLLEAVFNLQSHQGRHSSRE